VAGSSWLRLQQKRIAEAEDFTALGAGGAGVDGESVEVIEAIGGRPRRQLRVAQSGEAFLKATVRGAGLRFARGNWTARARVAALEGDITDLEPHDIALASGEELIFPEWRQGFGRARRADCIDFERGAETPAGFVERHTGKPTANSLERGCGNDCWSGGEAVVWKSFARVADLNRLLEVHAEPYRGTFGIAWKGEAHCRDAAPVSGNREGHGTDVRRIRRADEVHSSGALAIDPSSVDRVKSPDAVKFEAAIGPKAGFVHRDRIEGFDGMQTDIRQARHGSLGVHA
jgi:hypothetical protein